MYVYVKPIATIFPIEKTKGELPQTCPISAKEAFEYYKKNHILDTSHQHHQKNHHILKTRVILKERMRELKWRGENIKKR